MVGWFGSLVVEALVGGWTLQEARLLFDTLQKAAATAAIVVGGGWAYLKFVRGRTFKLRLEPSVAGVVWRGPGPEAALYLAVDCRAKNAGLSKFVVSLEESALQVFTSAAPGVPRAAEDGAGAGTERVDWEELGGYPVFEDAARGPLEPGEQPRTRSCWSCPASLPAADPPPSGSCSPSRLGPAGAAPGPSRGL